MVLSGLDGDLRFEDFLDYPKNDNVQSNQESCILAYISNLSSDDLFDSMKRHTGFKIKQLGEIVELRINNHSRKRDDSDYYMPEYSYYYCYYESLKNLLLCFTRDTM